MRAIDLAKFALVAAFASDHPALAADLAWKINERAASRIVSEATQVSQQRFDYDRKSALSPPFFVFQGMGAPPAGGSFGYFAVNPWTGDVWSLWGCRKVSTVQSRRSQAEIRKRFTALEMKEYSRLASLKPACIVED